MCSLGILWSCSSIPSSQDKVAYGRIVSSSVYSTYVDRRVGGTQEIPTKGGGMVSIPTLAVPIERRTYLVELRLNGGGTIRTTTDREMAIGECVRLWHSGATDTASSGVTLVPGTLEAAAGQCP